MGGLDGKVALVTGGTRGIGLACAKRLARDGARVAVCGRDAAAAEEAAREIGHGARGYGCDVGDSAAVDRLFAAVEETLGPICILVNNAGITRDGLLVRMKDADWDAVQQTNLAGAFHCCRAAARGMIKRREGRIINITSVVALRGQAGQANYAAAKAGLIGFTKSYAREVASRNITVNAVAPGYIQTGMTSGMDAKAVETALAHIPLGRPGSPEDVAAAVAFLAGDSADYITGAVIAVDGGLGM